MEIAKGIIIPVLADYVLSPDIYYGDNVTGIYFQTENNQFGRITFNNLDAIKVCRGENLPYPDNWIIGEEVTWVYKVENSKWLNERFNYENENYGSSYEFGGDVHEMLTDFSHYIFQFHDQFVEVIARGFWFEKSEENLFKEPFQAGHPLLPLPDTETLLFEGAGIKYKAIFNPISIDKLVYDSQYCQQKLFEIAVEFEGRYSVNQTMVILERQGKIVSMLRQLSGRPIFEKDGVATFDDIKPFIDKEIFEIAERRNQMRK